MTDPLKPSAALLCKLGSCLVHVSEFHSPDGHPADRVAFESIMADLEVVEWVKQMDKLALLPKTRD